MSDPCKALLSLFDSGLMEWPREEVLFLNGEDCAGLPKQTILQQYFKSKARNSVAEIPDRMFPLVLLLGSRQHQETQYLIGRALDLLTENGFLVCAAANDAGGKRLRADLESLGMRVLHLSKKRCRVVWAQKKVIVRRTGSRRGRCSLFWIKSLSRNPVFSAGTRLIKGRNFLPKHYRTMN